MFTEIIKINENTWRIEDGFVRLFLLAGSEKALLIDSGATCPDAKKIAQTLTDLPLSLLNTHADGDHTAGNGAFSAFYMHPADYQKGGMAQKFSQSTLLPIQDGDEIDLGGRVLNIIGIPGHTFGSVAVLDVQNRALYSGDSVQNGHIFMFGAHRSPVDFGSSLQKLMTMEEQFDVIHPSHGAPDLPADYIEKVFSVWQKVQNGTLTGTVESMHGTQICTYTDADCGFYCNA